MGEVAAKKLCFGSVQPCQTKVLPSAGSAFKVWQNPSAKHLKSNTVPIFEGKGVETGLNLNVPTTEEIDQDHIKKMKRRMANREYARNHRLKEKNHVINLEKQVSSLEAKISNVQAQIEESKSYKRSMLNEQHQMKLRMAALENDRVVIQDQIEHNKAEVKRLVMKRLQMIKQSQNLEHAINSMPTPPSDNVYSNSSSFDHHWVYSK
ncbi:hypothetical protein HN51_061317 [Arachis hypogaea]|nr:uncharacterized protein DS421_11g321220 [Arachis hypogaea]